MKHQFWLLAIVCSTVLADSMPEPGLATPAYIPPPPTPIVATAPVYIPQQTVYYNQPTYTPQPVQQTVYYNTSSIPKPRHVDAYDRIMLEREQVFGNMYIHR